MDGITRNSHPKWMRISAISCALIFAWTLVLAAPAYAISHHAFKKLHGMRTLSKIEMDKIVGSTTIILQPGGSGTGAVTGTANATALSWYVKWGQV